MASPCDGCPGLGDVSWTSGHHRECNAPGVMLGRTLDFAERVMLTVHADRFGVKQNPHGVRNGWAQWPMQMDTIWVESCALRPAVERKLAKLETEQATQ